MFLWSFPLPFILYLFSGLLLFPFGCPVFLVDAGDRWLIFKMRHEHAGWKSSGHGVPQIVVSLGVFVFKGWLVSRGNFPA